MNIRFPSEKTNNCYDVLLAKIGFKYTSNVYDGSVYVCNCDNANFFEILTYFLEAKSINIFRPQKIDACICLLHNPFFTDLCDYIEANAYNMPKRQLRLLRRKMFKYLADDTHKEAIHLPNLIGRTFMQDHNCYSRSKEILRLIDTII